MKLTLLKRTLINRALLKRNFTNSGPLRVIALPFVVLPLVLVAYAAAGGVPTDPDIAAILSNVDSNRIQNTALTLQNFRTRQSCSDQPEPGHGVTAARDFILAQYKSIPGLQVRLDPFVHAGCPSAPTFNVIAWLPGKHRNRLVIIGGHYDSRTTLVTDSASDAPGGNDSGAQTAVVLELARVFAGHAFDSTIVFMSFSGEEQGLFGSASIAANLNRYFEEPQVVAMLNTDIPGGDQAANTPADLQNFRLYSPGIPRERLSTDPDGTTDNTSPARGVMRYVGTWGGAYVPSITMAPKLREDRPGRASDHVSFLNNAYPAVRLMETFECSPSPVDNSCGGPLPCPPPANVPAFCKDTTFITTHQHSPNDQVQFITPTYAATIAQVMAAVAGSLARAPASPQGFKANGNALQGVRIKFDEIEDSHVDHLVVAARSVNENFYRQRLSISGGEEHPVISPQALGLTPGDSFFVSVAAVDKLGHESLFAYPEVRCDSSACAIPPYAYNVTAPLPPPPPAKDPAEDDD
jgi:Peptidase family M28